MSVLVTGGAGYIGSHQTLALIESGEKVIVVDNLETGARKAVHPDAVFVEGDLRDTTFVKKLFAENEIDSVIHFAAYSLVGESVSAPAKYYGNNVISALNLLNAMTEAGVKRIVFSSTAAVYGEPENVPILETDRTVPGNPYGESKLAVEKMLKWFDKAYGIKYKALRYFNVAGAHTGGNIGEAHNPETHLIPIVLKAALGILPHINVFGTDYDTPDGTCIRDYVHVSDLADAHLLAMNSLRAKAESSTYNLGNGNGFSVMEVIETARRVTGREIPAKTGERRAGDPSRLVASSEKITREFGFKPVRHELETIIETAWKWHQSHPSGYEK